MTSNPSPKVRAKRRARTAFRQRERRYPIWSARAILGVGLIAVIIATILTLALGHQRLLVELELTLGIVAIGLFLFLTTGLYLGARVRKNEQLVGELKLVDTGVGNLDVGSGIDLTSGADDPLGCLFAVIVGVLLSVLIVILMLLFLNLAAIVFFLFMLAVGWIFHRALRNVFAKSKRCRGDLLASIAYAGMYTLLYTGWLLAILMAVDWLKGRVAHKEGRLLCPSSGRTIDGRLRVKRRSPGQTRILCKAAIGCNTPPNLRRSSPNSSSSIARFNSSSVICFAASPAAGSVTRCEDSATVLRL